MKKLLPKLLVIPFTGCNKFEHTLICSLQQIQKKAVFFLVILFSVSNCFAQTNIDTAYQNVIAKRSAKIVDDLGINKKKHYNIVHQIIIQQYYDVNTIHNNYSSALIQIKSKQLSNEENLAALQVADNEKKNALQKLHTSFVNAQVEKVKDGMTYSVVPKTWAAYKEMLPNLTQEQKDKMYAWLIEARELAMDESSSDKKHAVFGKYKGKINNYLSAAGYDMKKEGEEWAKRIKAAKEIKQTQN
jgi:hypothetical protein